MRTAICITLVVMTTSCSRPDATVAPARNELAQSTPANQPAASKPVNCLKPHLQRPAGFLQIASVCRTEARRGSGTSGAADVPLPAPGIA
jgi:hypothetical protein